jgi:hypothetical protein
MKSEKPPIFILGCAHSATSLLLRVLGCHSQICAIPFESNFAFQWPTACEGSRGFFARCDKYMRAMGKARWVEKTPGHVFRIKEILDYYPEGKIFLSLRDGRDVACSLQERLGSLEAGIDRWIMNNRAGQRFWGHPQVHVVRYENLVTDFENAMRGVMAFVGEEFEDAVRNFHETPRYYFTSRVEKPPNESGENHGMYRNWQVNQPLFDGRGKWRRLTEEEKQMIKRKAGEMLIEFGYATDLNW